MQGQANIVEAWQGGWPRVSDRDAAAMRLALCRHLLEQIGDDRQPTAGGSFAEVGAYLNRWTERRVRADPGGFCQDTVRMLGLMLSQLERGDDMQAGIAPTASLAIG